MKDFLYNAMFFTSITAPIVLMVLLSRPTVEPEPVLFFDDIVESYMQEMGLEFLECGVPARLSPEEIHNPIAFFDRIRLEDRSMADMSVVSYGLETLLFYKDGDRFLDVKLGDFLTKWEKFQER